MLQMISFILLCWLVVGFISGVKIVYIDKEVERMIRDVESGEVKLTDEEMVAYEWMGSKKHIHLAIYTLLGAYSFYLDTVNTFKRD